MFSCKKIRGGAFAPPPSVLLRYNTVEVGNGAVLVAVRLLVVMSAAGVARPVGHYLVVVVALNSPY